MSQKIHLVGKTTVSPENVIFLKAVANYSEVFMMNGKKIMLSKTLKELEAIFVPYGFFRPHKSFLINLTHVVSCSFNDDRHIELIDNNKVELSRRKKNVFIAIRNIKKTLQH